MPAPFGLCSRREEPGTSDRGGRRAAQHPPGSKGVELVAGHPTVGGADFCLSWSESIESAADLLREHGLPVIDGPSRRRTADRLPALPIYFRDPDGSLLELMAANGTAAA